MAKVTPTQKKVAEIVAVLKAEGWTEILGTEFVGPRWQKQVAQQNSLLAMVHPTNKLGFCLGKNKTRYGGTKAGFFQANPDKKTGSYTSTYLQNTTLRSPLRWYVIGPITGFVINQAAKIITNKEGNVAVSYGI